MREVLNILDVRRLARADFKPTIILILSALLVTVHAYFGSLKFALRVWPSAGRFEAAMYMFLTAFLLLGALPAALVVAGFGERLRDYGVQLGDWRTGLRATLVLFPVIAVALLYPASQTAEMRAFYPFDPRLAPLELARGVFFYTAWEFFFRGFMLFGLRGRVGDWLAICIQTVPSCLWHIGCPTGEIVSSIPGGVLFGLLAVRTRSIVWPLLLHYLIGVGLDLFIEVTK